MELRDSDGRVIVEGRMHCLSKSKCARTACGLAMLCLAFAAVAADPEHPDENWITDSSNGCRIWNPNPQKTETVSWSGACRKGLEKAMG